MRNIDADKLCEALKCMASVQCPDKQNTILGVVSSIENFPTADVVPKSEVSILACQNMALAQAKCDLQHEFDKYKGVENILKDNMGKLILSAINGAKQEVAREIFEEIERLHLHITNEFDLRRYNELKKKYTEGKE